MKYLSVKKMRDLDKYTIEQIGIPGIVLMENAAIKIFDEILDKYGILKGKKILIIAGKGNNGGDGFALARHLFNNGSRVSIIILFNKGQIKGDALINLNIIKNMKLDIKEINNESDITKVQSLIKKTEIIVDAILGTGFTGKLGGLYAQVVSMINSSRRKIVCIDIPSGLNADTGIAEGEAVKADLTITLGKSKLGFKNKTSKKYLGELKVVDIGLIRRIMN